MDLRFDYYVRNKNLSESKSIFDKRAIKIKLTEREIFNRSLQNTYVLMGLAYDYNVEDFFYKIDGIENKNLILLIITYNYFQLKNFDFNEVVLNFEEDYKNIEMELEKYFSVENNEKFYLRQDFISYLLLLNNNY